VRSRSPFIPRLGRLRETGPDASWSAHGEANDCPKFKMAVDVTEFTTDCHTYELPI